MSFGMSMLAGVFIAAAWELLIGGNAFGLPCPPEPTADWRRQQRQHSTRDAAEKAREDGLVFRKSRGFVPESTVHQMLRNPFYIGEFT